MGERWHRNRAKCRDEIPGNVSRKTLPVWHERIKAPKLFEFQHKVHVYNFMILIVPMYIHQFFPGYIDTASLLYQLPTPLSIEFDTLGTPPSQDSVIHARYSLRRNALLCALLIRLKYRPFSHPTRQAIRGIHETTFVYQPPNKQNVHHHKEHQSRDDYVVVPKLQPARH